MTCKDKMLYSVTQYTTSLYHIIDSKQYPVHPEFLYLLTPILQQFSLGLGKTGVGKQS